MSEKKAQKERESPSKRRDPSARQIEINHDHDDVSRMGRAMIGVLQQENIVHQSGGVAGVRPRDQGYASEPGILPSPPVRPRSMMTNAEDLRTPIRTQGFSRRANPPTQPRGEVETPPACTRRDHPGHYCLECREGSMSTTHGSASYTSAIQNAMDIMWITMNGVSTPGQRRLPGRDRPLVERSVGRGCR